jgi:lipopolysaccharide biosynthesis glycosyltransferase
MNAFATICTAGYEDYLKTMLWSMSKYSEISFTKFIIFYSEKQRMPDLKDINKIWPEVCFQKIDFDRYNNLGKWEAQYWSHEVFSLRGYDKVVFLDCDLLNMPGKSLRGIFENNYNLAMVKEVRRDCFNAGMIIISDKYLTDEIYERVLNHKKNPDIFGRDQSVYNDLFKNEIEKVDIEWNNLITETEFCQSPRLMHYICKPMYEESKQRMPHEIYNLWHKEHQEAVAWLSR